MDLQTAEEQLPQSINPLSLQIMRLTGEYTTNGARFVFFGSNGQTKYSYQTISPITDTLRQLDRTAIMTVWLQVWNSSLVWAKRRQHLGSCWAMSPGRQRMLPKSWACQQSWQGGNGAGKRKRKKNWADLQRILPPRMVSKSQGGLRM